ncbi:MAG: hypothetical protein RLZZ71_2125 [Bacteroidota bacterium]|jgi:hypothetical protein
MKVYTQNSLLKFGKYNGSILEDVAKKDPNYINWCVINLEHFYLSAEVIEHLQANSGLVISEEATLALEQKRSEISEASDSNDYDFDDYERRTYDDYNGSYAQDEMGWSDQDINDVFGGDADAYWNID